MSRPQTIMIRDVHVPVIEHSGQRVVTLAVIDAVHGRPTGTAGRYLNQNLTQFIENEDYFLAGEGYKGKKIKLITEAGYRKFLNYHLTTNRDRDVMWEMISWYFTAKEETATDQDETCDEMPGTDLQIFTSPEFGQIRTVTIDGESWFVGKDVATALGYSDTDQALRKHVDNEDKLTRRFDGSGQNRQMTIINESGLYSLILSSKLPSAKKFKRWVTSEVLPSIRKTGSYEIPQQTVEQTVTVTESATDMTDPTVYLKAAKIMATLPDSRRYVINILRHVVPDIDAGSVTETVTEVKTETAVTDVSAVTENTAIEARTMISRNGYTIPFNGLKLKNYMTENGINAHMLEEMSGVSRGSIHSYLRGEASPGTQNRMRITAALGVPNDYFNKRTRNKGGR